MLQSWSRVAVVGAALAISGCGTGADRAQVRATTARFLSAYAERSGGAACAQLSPALRGQLTKDERAPTCAAAVLELRLADRTIRRVRVFATSATVELGGESLFLSVTAAGWRIDALGCRPTGAGPYHCEARV